MEDFKARIKAEAKRLGFSFLGVAQPKQTRHFKNYLEWVNKGGQGDLEYLAKDYVINGRRDPESLLKDAKSVIVAGIHYTPQIGWKDIYRPDNKEYGWIASYACLPDYHHTLRHLFQQLGLFIQKVAKKTVNTKIFIDSGPVMEKDFAYQAGLGWIGKNSLLISPLFGSYCLLGCMFIDIHFEPGAPIDVDICKDCEICIKACPTSCINSNRTIDASRCISYQTIENPSLIPDNIKKKLGGWVFGCDICQMVCPANRFLTNKQSEIYTSFVKPIINQKINLQEALFINKTDFIEKYGGTPVARIGFETFMRNIKNAFKNQLE